MCALSMIMSVTFSVSAAPAADAKGVFISYNAAESTDEYATYDFYIKGFGTEIKKINVAQYVSTSVFECPASGSINVEIAKYVNEGSGNMVKLSSTGKVTMTWSNGSGTIAIREDGLIATFRLPIKSAAEAEWVATGSGAFQKVTDVNGTELNFANGTNVTGDYAGYVFVADKYVPASSGGSVNATQSGSTFTDAADAQAVAYYVELDSSASEKTGRWYATIGTTPMKTKATFTLPNISAENVKLGLVYKGAETISNVAFKWE